MSQKMSTSEHKPSAISKL